MIGKTTSSEIRYLRGHNGEEIHEDKDKERTFRENWKKNISNIKQRKSTICRKNDKTVTEFLDHRKHLLEPKQNTDFGHCSIETDLISFKEI